MIKPSVLTSLFLLIGVAGDALAVNCRASPGYVRVTNSSDELKNLLSGRTLCKSTGSQWQWQWQEYHDPGGNLIDYKKGPSDTIDPSELVGSWQTSNGSNAVVTYDYGSGGTYSYRVWKSSIGYDFCGLSGMVKNIAMKDGSSGC